MSEMATTKNGGILPLGVIPRLSYQACGEIIHAKIQEDSRLAACFAVPEKSDDSRVSIFLVLANNTQSTFSVIATEPASDFLSLTPQIAQLHLFEREIAEQYGIVFVGHPWFKPVRFHAPWSGTKDAWNRDPQNHPLVGEMDYFQVEGEEVHEVGVGPVHAGIIEPGHFRFQCYGEKVLHLEISLGYQHRGVECLLADGPWPQTPMQIETMAGDSSIAHMTAYSLALEALAGVTAPPRASAIRALALELERLANHVGDIGALAGDIGFLPTASFCGRLRGDYLNMTGTLCGSRFGRGLVRPGGVLFDINPGMPQKLLDSLGPVSRDTEGALDLFFDTPSVLARLEGTGPVSAKKAFYLGLVGVAGRACGLDCDVRRFHGGALYPNGAVPAMVEEGGDVYARALIRRQEVTHSLDYMHMLLENLPEGQPRKNLGKTAPDSLALSMVEGWRGPVTHAIITGSRGEFRRYKVIDPSFFNWTGLAMALRNEQISDFPLCNKSFNLSYCGFDL